MDLNQRPPASEAGTLARLSYALLNPPWRCRILETWLKADFSSNSQTTVVTDSQSAALDRDTYRRNPKADFRIVGVYSWCAGDELNTLPQGSEFTARR